MQRATNTYRRYYGSMPGAKVQRVKTVIALVITIGAFLSVYYLLKYLVGIEEEVCGGIAGLSFGLFVHIDQALKNGQVRVWRPTWPRDIVPLDRYALPWQLMILYGIVLSLTPLILFVSLLFMSTNLRESTGITAAYNAMSALVVLVLSFTGSAQYGIGSWVGTRSKSPRLLVVLAIAVLSTEAFLYLFFPLLILLHGFGRDLTLSSWFVEAALENLWVSIGFAFVLFVPMALGLWRGRKKRMANYLNYLLSRLSEDDRKAVLNMVYESTKETPSDGAS